MLGVWVCQMTLLRLPVLVLALLDWGVGGARTAVRPKLSTSCSAWACESGAEPQRAPRASCPAALRA